MNVRITTLWDYCQVTCKSIEDGLKAQAAADRATLATFCENKWVIGVGVSGIAPEDCAKSAAILRAQVGP